MDLSVSVCSSH
ncbi:UNVERIFIED_CONTAM: hypothetical protein NCL1_46914 [Trichonephila clavipes]